jgi:hypothetical protein
VSSKWSHHIEILDRQAEFERHSQQRVFRLIQAMAAGDRELADKALDVGVALDLVLDLDGPDAIPVPPGWKDLVGPSSQPGKPARLSPLAWAAASNQSYWVQWLLANDATPSLPLHDGKDAAWFAMERGYLDIHNWLLDHGASAKLRLSTPAGHTRLIGAVLGRHVQIVGKLLARGADPNESDNQWSTPLHHNFRQDPYTNEDGTIARMLLAEHADPLSEDKSGLQAGALARSPEQLALIEGYKIRQAVEATLAAAAPEPVAVQPDGTEPAPAEELPDVLPGIPQLKRPPKKPRI